MGIFSRLSDIVNSNLNALLDRAEDPAKMIRLVIQEMEDTLVEVRTDAARAIAERKEAMRRRETLDRGMAEWERRAELALERGREDLAKAALMEKAALVETGKALEAEIDRLDEAMARSDSDIGRLQAKLAEAKAKQEALVARQDAASTRLKVRKTLYDGRVDDALARFDQMERRVDDVEGRVEAYDLGRSPTLAEEIAALEADARVEAEIAAMKERMATRRHEGAGSGGRS